MKFIVILLAVVATMLASFGIHAFYYVTTDISQWTEMGRFSCMTLGSSVAVFTSFIAAWEVE